MTTVLDVPGLQGPPDITTALQMLSEGLADRRKNREEETKRLLAQNIGSRLAGGDMAGAADAAFQSGDMKTGMDITAMGKKEKKDLLSTVGRYAAMADSPEKYNRIVPILEQMLPGFAQEYPFEKREALIAETLSLEEQFTLEDRATKEQERTSKAPDVVNLNGIDHIWDAQAGKFVAQPGGVLDADKKKSQGIVVRNLPDGTTETVIGGEGGQPLTGPTANKVQEKAFNAAELGSRVAGVMADFKPEYQTLLSKALNTKRSWQAWLDPNSLSAGDRKGLEDFVEFRTKAVGNLSAYLQEMSGAAISDTEFGRLAQFMPNAGTGMFDGDDPVTFKKKMTTVMNEVDRALARYNYYQTIGIPASLDQIPLNNVQKVKGKWYVKDGDQVFEVGTVNAVQP